MDFLTRICGELDPRGQEWGSSIRSPEPIVCPIAHHRQGCTCVHLHDCFWVVQQQCGRGSTQDPQVHLNCLGLQVCDSVVFPHHEYLTSGHGPSCGSQMPDDPASYSSDKLLSCTYMRKESGLHHSESRRQEELVW